MYYIVGTLEQYQAVKTFSGGSIPSKVLDALEDKVKILDYYYGKDRDLEKDMGDIVLSSLPVNPLTGQNIEVFWTNTTYKMKNGNIKSRLKKKELMKHG